MTKSICTLILSLGLSVFFLANAAQGQSDLLIYGPLDLNDDGLVNNEDVNIFHGTVSPYGHLGRGTRIPIAGDIAHLDFDQSGDITLADGVTILQNFGHFNSDKTVFYQTPNGCQLGDFNADGFIDEGDMDEFESGFNFWRWWNLFRNIGSPDKPAIYSFGDVDMDGVIDELDFLYLRLSWSAGTGDFDERYPDFLDDYTIDVRPSDPTGLDIWLTFMF